MQSLTQRRRPRAVVAAPLRPRFAFAALISVAIGSGAQAFDLEGFTEPYRTIRVAADETGTIAEVFVKEGERVNEGVPLARLNSEIHEAMLAIAEQNMNAKGRLEAALADMKLRQVRLEKLNDLRRDGHARQEEVDRAASEYTVAEANVRTAQEEQVTRRLEYERAKAQIDRRTIHAPISGVIIATHKDVGEFLAPNDPDLLTLVQIDALLANFTLTSFQAESLSVGQELTVWFGPELSAPGVVEFISPVTNAESGTVLVKLRIENPDGMFRSGARCRIRLEE